MIDYENRIGVHICTRNRESYLAVLLTSLLQQTYQNFDVVIVDDCSDAYNIYKSKIILDTCQRLKNTKHKVRILRNPTRLLICKSRNLAIQHDPNQICCRIDDDSWCDPAYLEKLHKTITGNPNLEGIISKEDYKNIVGSPEKIGAVGGLVPYWARPPYYKCSKKMKKFEIIKARKDGTFINASDNGHFHFYPDAIFPTDHLRSSFMFRKEAVIKAGLHATEYGVTGFREETDLCIRILDQGYKLYTDTSAKCWHLLAGGPGRDLLNRDYKEMVDKNEEHFKKKMKPFLKRLKKGGVI